MKAMSGEKAGQALKCREEEGFELLQTAQIPSPKSQELVARVPEQPRDTGRVPPLASMPCPQLGPPRCSETEEMLYSWPHSKWHSSLITQAGCGKSSVWSYLTLPQQFIFKKWNLLTYKQCMFCLYFFPVFFFQFTIFEHSSVNVIKCTDSCNPTTIRFQNIAITPQNVPHIISF